jgi:hypothetical protein
MPSVAAHGSPSPRTLRPSEPHHDKFIADGLHAAEKYLGIRELSKRFRAPEHTIRAWRFGHEMMPEHQFVRLTDILKELAP